MKILVTSIVDIRKSAHNSRLHQFLKYLSKRHKITVLCINDKWKSDWDDRSVEYYKDFEQSLSGIKILYLTERRLSPVLQEIFSVATVNSILREIKNNKFDLHFNYNTLIFGYIVARKLKQAGVNTVYDLADDLPEMIRTSPQIPNLLKPIGGFVGNIAVSKNIEISKRVTFTTYSLRSSYDIPPDKSELIPNGVDTELFRRYPPDELKRELGINNCFVVGYAGVLRERLDLDTLFKAVKQLTDRLEIRLLIVGGGIGYEENVNLARKYGLLKNIVFTGTVPYTQLPKYISCMDVCVIPFKSNTVSQNSLPLKLFEYMACEKPVISTKLEGVMAAVQDRVLYVSNAEEYKDKIIELYKDSEFCRRLGREGRGIVEKDYNWSKIISRLEEVLKRARKT